MAHIHHEIFCSMNHSRHEQAIIPFAMIFMQAINKPPAAEYFRDVACFRAICGDTFLPNVLLVATSEGGRRRRVEQEERTPDHLCKDPQLWKPLLRQGARLIQFDLSDPLSAHNILDNLPVKSPERPLRIQSEMAKGKDVRATSAWWKATRSHHRWFCRLRHILGELRCVCDQDEHRSSPELATGDSPRNQVSGLNSSIASSSDMKHHDSNLVARVIWNR